MKRKEKWCATCGQRVNLSKKGAAAMNEQFALASHLLNKDYWYWCSDNCFKGRKSK